jgi:hypothetical protein
LSQAKKKKKKKNAYYFNVQCPDADTSGDGMGIYLSAASTRPSQTFCTWQVEVRFAP